MMRETVLCILLLLVTSILLPTIHVAESIKLNDKFEYDYKITLDYKQVMPKFPQQGSVECNIKLEFSGVVIYQVYKLTNEVVSIRVAYNNTRVDHYIKCNDTETENRWREMLADTSRRISESLRQETSIEIPLMRRFNETIAPHTDLPIMIPFLPISFPSTWFNYTVVRTIYRNRPCLLVKTWGEINQSIFGMDINIKANGLTYTDITGSLVYYAVSELDVQMDMRSPSQGMFQGYLLLTCKAKYEVELRNIDKIDKYGTIGLEVGFKERKGTVLVSGYEITLNSYKVDGNKLILNTTSSGLGGVLVNTTREISVLNIYVDGVRASFVKEDVEGFSIIRLPIIYSNHTVEIEFSEEITEVRQLEFEKPGFETLLNLSTIAILAIVIVVPVAIILFVIKRFKKK